jgi:hypothetical protein
MADLLRQSVYGRLTGYEYLHDAERLAVTIDQFASDLARRGLRGRQSFDAVFGMKKLGVDPQRV